MKLLTVLLLALLALTVAANVKGKWFDHVVIYIAENQPYSKVMADANFVKYAKLGRSLDNHYAIRHPSQPNYVALIAGDTLGVVNDLDYNLAQTSLIDLFLPHNVTWKSYQEGYPGGCYTGTYYGRYVRKHNPFISFNRVRSDRQLCARIVNAGNFTRDLESGMLPNYSFYTPDMDNDGHDTGLAFAGKALDSWMSKHYSSIKAANALLVITWDEDNNKENNHIYTALLHPKIQPGSVDNARSNHYSLLRMIEDNFGIGTLSRNDKTATPIKLWFFP